MRVSPGLFFGLALLSTPQVFAAATAPPKPAEIMGLLKTHCISCHSTAKQKGGLSLETREAALQGGDQGASLVPGKGGESALIHALTAEGDAHMPPKKQLPEKQIALLKAWVDAGALWDDKALAGFGEPADADKLGDLPPAKLPVMALSLNPAGTRLAAAHGNEVRIHDVTQPNRPVVATLKGHRDVVQSLAWSPDGSKLAAGGYRLVKIWNPADGAELASWTAPLEGRVSALAFLPDQTSLLVADGAAAQRGVLHQWKLGADKPEATWEAHTDNIVALTLSQDGRLFATGGADNVARVWDAASHKLLGKFEGHAGAVMGVAFNKDATWLATGSADKELKVWDVKTKEQLVQLSRANTPITGLQWSADGQRLISINDEGLPRVFTELKAHEGAQSQANSAKETKLAVAGTNLQAVTATADGMTVYAGGGDGSVITWAADGKLTRLEETTTTPAAATPGPAPVQVLATAPVPAKQHGQALSFTQDILPILGKAGCSMGSCHAKASGQAGFKLSVFSFDPRSDWAEVVQDTRGRRVFPALAEESLLLRKATGSVAHEGGQRFEETSEFYKTVANWIRQGMPYEVANQPKLTGIEVDPPDKTYKKNESLNLKVTARYSDGSSRDVTALTEYASNDAGVVAVDEHGHVQATPYSGEAVVVARYMGHVGISKAAIPSEKVLPAERYAGQPENNEIDRLVYARLKQLGHLPSETCTDAEFIRRVTLDGAGLLPTVEETKAFLASTDPKKREKWIDQILQRPEWADHWAVKWGDLLRPNPSRVGVKPVLLMDTWIRQSFRDNKPWDQFVRELLTAQGSSHQDGRVAFLRDKRDPIDAAAFVGQIFLGVRLECAKCHQHPSERWNQSDYYQLAAFFTQMKRKGQGISAPISGEPEYWWFAPGEASIAHPVTNEPLKPKAPAAEQVSISANQDPRTVLVDWMVKPENPLFARATVNRVWQALLGRGIVEPVDDFRASNPPSNAPLLDWLAQDFVAHKFDLKHLMRTIMRSHVYQLSTLPNETNLADTRNYSRAYRKRLPAEVLLDAVSEVTQTSETFTSTPAGTLAKQTWNHKLQSEFMDAFGRPNASAECPCERDAKPSVVQALHLMNSTRLQARLVDATGRVGKLATGTLAPDSVVDELYLATFSRLPLPEEKAVAVKVIADAGAGDARKAAVEDVLWALLNSAEFVFNH